MEGIEGIIVSITHSSISGNNTLTHFKNIVWIQDTFDNNF